MCMCVCVGVGTCVCVCVCACVCVCVGEMGLGEVGGRRGRGAEEEDGEADWRCGWVVVAGAGI